MAKRNPITVEGVEYASKTAYAIAMVAAGKSQSEAAKLAGINPATVNAYTTGKEKRAERAKVYKAIKLGKGQKASVSEIAQRTGFNVNKVMAILKKNNISLVKTKRTSKAKTAETTKTAETAKTVETPAQVETPAVNETVNAQA